MSDAPPLRRILGTIVAVRADLVGENAVKADTDGYVNRPEMRRLKDQSWRASWNDAVEKGRCIEDDRMLEHTGCLAEKVAPNRGNSFVHAIARKATDFADEVQKRLPKPVADFMGDVEVIDAAKATLKATVVGELIQSPLRGDDYRNKQTWGYAASMLAYEVTTGVAAALAGGAVSSIATAAVGIPVGLGTKVALDTIRDQTILAGIDFADCMRTAFAKKDCH